MSVEQLPGPMRDFAAYLSGLLARLEHGAGWCAVFWQRDPDGMRACLDGRDVPPWDVVEALLQDLAAKYGPEAAVPGKERARPLHAAALLAHDTRPGGRDALGDRLGLMLREQRYAAERLAELERLLPTAASRGDADALRLDLAWARDDHDRATARCAELRARLAELDRPAAPGRVRGARRIHLPTADRTPPPGPGAPAPVGTAAHPLPSAPAHAVPRPAETADPAPAPKQRKRRRGGARFAGMVDEEAVPAVVAPDAVPVLPAPAPAAGRTPRGARFAGAAAEPLAPGGPPAEPVDAAALREAAATVATLVRLRREGRTGEAHVLLVEAAYWPADHLPLLAAEMDRAGLAADWATLLWEAASLPAGQLVAAADALVAAGRAADGEQILRQGMGRPAEEVGRAVLGLAHDGRRREIRALLDAYVRVRTPEEVARSAEADPQTLVPLLLEAALGVSAERHWDLVHALRVAGLTA
ncbi:hypothetical protein [Streptomyces cinereospinus]|uniref:hypothetical protein n=1 Tax=Streptomyces cinereospinus TaxID=285561 RepID=UPI00361BCAF5